MIYIMLILFGMYALTYALKESVLFDKPRIWLIRQSSFFYHMLECWLCTGFWSGIIIYLIANTPHSWDIREAFIWGLGSSGISFLTNVVVEKLTR